MKVINKVICVLVIIVKGLLVIAQLIGMFVYALTARMISRRSFKRELYSCGLPREAVGELGRAYKDMLSLNIFSYMR